MSIQARYSGICPECGERWEPGDLIRSADAHLPLEQRRRPAVWRHQICPESVEKTEGEVCPRRHRHHHRHGGIMTRYFKAVRPDGTDFHSGTVRWLPKDGTIPPEGWLVTHPTSKRIGLKADSYLSVSTVATDCIGMRWPCRLLEVVPAGRQVHIPEPDRLPRKRVSVAWRVVAELPAHEALGPQGASVAAIIERAGRLTQEEVWKIDTAQDTVWHAARVAVRDTAQDTVWYAARVAARDAAWDAARDTVWHAARVAVRDAAGYAAWDAAREAVLATLTRDLITVEHYDTLMAPWRAGLEAS